jgi:hypothetical protein
MYRYWAEYFSTDRLTLEEMIRIDLGKAKVRDGQMCFEVWDGTKYYGDITVARNCDEWEMSAAIFDDAPPNTGTEAIKLFNEVYLKPLGKIVCTLRPTSTQQSKYKWLTSRLGYDLRSPKESELAFNADGNSGVNIILYREYVSKRAGELINLNDHLLKAVYARKMFALSFLASKIPGPKQMYYEYSSHYYLDAYLFHFSVLISYLAFEPGEYRDRLLAPDFPLDKTQLKRIYNYRGYCAHVLEFKEAKRIIENIGSDGSPLKKLDPAFIKIWGLIRILHQELDTEENENSESYIIEQIKMIDDSILLLGPTPSK